VRAIFFLSFFVFALIVAVRAPYVASLIYIWVDMLAPQSVGYGFIEAMPLSLYSGIASILFYFLFDKKERVHLGFQWMCLVAFAVWISITTVTIAELPDFARVKWDWAFKTLMFACFMPFVFRTRVRLEALILTLLACVGTVAGSLALKTFVGGVGYGSTRIWGGVNATSLGESSSYALVAAAMIPFIWVLHKHSLFLTKKANLKWVAISVIFIFIVSIIGSYARTGLVCLAILGGLLYLRSKHKFVVGFVAVMLLAVSLPLLPEAWLTRMQSIENSETEGSSSQRFGVWAWTLDYIAENPLGGGFEVYRINKIEYTAADPKAPNDPSRTIKLTAQARAFHSNYFEVLGEHGWPGLILYLIIQGLTWRKCWKMWRTKLPEQHAWLSAYAGANLLNFVMIMVGTAFTGNAFKIFTYLPAVIGLTLWNLFRKMQQEVDPASFSQKTKTKIGLERPVPVSAFSAR
jgi:probable O-glycosylation ligase (exosortase A-associated)